MALNPPKPIEVGELINSSNEDVYTVTGDTRTVITAATAHNTDTTARTLTIWLGASATNATKRFLQSIAPNDTIDIYGIIGQSMNSGEKIIAVSSAVDVISVRVTGTEYPVG
jgi:hypothetical protein